MLLLAPLAFATAVLSATLGMAGGLVLMGAFTLLLPVPEAMVMHGLVQLVANAGRAWMLRAHIVQKGLVGYAAGAVVAVGVAGLVAWTPPKAAVWLGLGLVPFVALALPRSRWLDAGTPVGGGLAGLLVVGTQSAFGVAGPLLDVFFTDGSLDRHAVVATKAATQVVSHVGKIVLFAGLATLDRELGVAAAASMVAAAAGTRVGGWLLDRVPEAAFRRWTRRVVLGVGAGYVVAGIVGLAG